MTLIRRVPGWINADFKNKRSVMVHYSCDHLPEGGTNETISFTTAGRQLTMKWKPIEAIISKERGFKYKNFHFIIDESELYIPTEWIEEWLKEHGQSTEMIDDWKAEAMEAHRKEGEA